MKTETTIKFADLLKKFRTGEALGLIRVRDSIHIPKPAKQQGFATTLFQRKEMKIRKPADHDIVDVTTRWGKEELDLTELENQLRYYGDGEFDIQVGKVMYVGKVEFE